MNQEAVFALRFVMKDFAKMRKAVDEMNKNIAKMQKNANGASRGIDKVSTSMGKATRSVLKFAAAYFTLSKITSTVFSKSHEAIQVQLLADAAGVATTKIGKLGRALRLYGGDAKSAGSAYASLTNIIGGATHGMGISEDVMRVNAMYGIGFNYGNVSQDTLLTEIARSMHELKGKNDQWAINQIASAYGLDSSMAAFLAEKGANWQKYVNSKEYKDLAKSDIQKLLEIEDAYDEFMKDITQKIYDVLSWMAEKMGYKATDTTAADALKAQGFTQKDVDKILKSGNVVLSPAGVITDKGLYAYPAKTTENERKNAHQLLRMGFDMPELYSAVGMDAYEYAVKHGTMTLDEMNRLRTESGLSAVKYNEDTNTFLRIELIDKDNKGIGIGSVSGDKNMHLTGTSIK